MRMLIYFISSYPKRLRRFLTFPFSIANLKRPFCILEWLMLLFDLLGIPEIIQVVHCLLNWHQRKLSSEEYELAYAVFQDSIKWRNVRLNYSSWICQRFRFAFVGFHTIHFSKTIPDDILIHELVHIWQYEKYGSAYIVRALHAQRTTMGYKYGGVLALQMHKHLEEFNFEQMAEVVRDGYLQRGRTSIYNKYMQQLLE